MKNGCTVKLPLEKLLFGGLAALSIVLQGSWFAPAYLSLFGVLAFLTVWKLRTGRLALRTPESKWFCLFVLSYVVLGILGGHFSYPAVVSSFKLLLGFQMFLLLLLDKRFAGAFFAGIWTGCLLVCLIGLFGYFGAEIVPDGVLVDGGVRRLQSLLQYANTTALLMLIGYLLTVYYRRMCKNARWKMMLYGLEMLFLTAAFLTFSKMVLALLLGGVVAALFVVRDRQLLAGLLMTTLLAAAAALLCTLFIMCGLAPFAGLPLLGLLLLQLICSRMQWKLGDSAMRGLRWGLCLLYGLLFVGGMLYVILADTAVAASFRSSLFSRLVYMRDACRAIAAHPLLGIGPGMWADQQGVYQSAFYQVPYIHNGILQFALDAGIPAMLLFLCAVGWYAARMIQKWRRKTCGAQDKICFCMVLLMVIHSLFDVDLSFPAVFAILSGCLALAPEKTTEKPFLVYSIVPGICSMLLGTFAVYLLLGQGFYFAGQKSYQTGNGGQAMEAFQTARIFRPNDADVLLMLAKANEQQQGAVSNTYARLAQAREKNPYDYFIVQGLYVTAYRMGDFNDMYRWAWVWLDIQPLSSQAYEAAVIALQQLYQAGQATEEQLTQEKERLIGAASAANQSMRFPAQYMEHYRKIELETIWGSIFVPSAEG